MSRNVGGINKLKHIGRMVNLFLDRQWQFLFCRLEELRHLNYSLDVELQKERSDRMKLEEKVMSPRSAQASKILPQSDKGDR